MRLRLDSSKCEGHGRCYTLAPSLFAADDEGYSVLLVTGDIPGEYDRDARMAVANCPEFAIDIVE